MNLKLSISTFVCPDRQFTAAWREERWSALFVQGSTHKGTYYCTLSEYKTFKNHLVQRSHSGRRRGNDVVHEKEESVIRTELNSLADKEVELAHCKV